MLAVHSVRKPFKKSHFSKLSDIWIFAPKTSKIVRFILMLFLAPNLNKYCSLRSQCWKNETFSHNCQTLCTAHFLHHFLKIRANLWCLESQPCFRDLKSLFVSNNVHLVKQKVMKKIYRSASPFFKSSYFEQPIP